MATVPDRFIPFAREFEGGDARTDLIGLTRAEAEERAEGDGLRVRAIELPLPVGRHLWTTDHHGDRLNLVVEHGRVIRAAVF